MKATTLTLSIVLAATLNYVRADCDKPGTKTPNWAYFHGTWWFQCKAYKTAKDKHPDIIYIPTKKAPGDNDEAR